MGEPPPTRGDIHFRVLNTPVRIHPFFWLTTFLLGSHGLRPTPPIEILIWILVVLVSILIHEFGHAIMQRHYGGRPWITLYGLGGLASCDDCDRSSKAQIQICLAGPIAGFLLATVVFFLVRITGTVAGFQWSSDIPFASLGIEKAMVMPLGITNFYWEPLQSDFANSLIGDLIQVNILWGLINLLPIYPLDGGQVSREVCMFSDAQQGIIRSLQISMFCAIAMAVVGLFFGRLFMAFLFGYLAYMSYRSLEAYKASLW